MSLKIGVWKLYRNGIEGTLTIDSVDEKGYLQGKIKYVESYEISFRGTWDKAGQILTFGPLFFFQEQTGGVIAIMEYYKGFLFGIPSDPAPGKDILWTLTGFYEITDLRHTVIVSGNITGPENFIFNEGYKPSIRRTKFGWFAQVIEEG